MTITKLNAPNDQATDFGDLFFFSFRKRILNFSRLIEERLFNNQIFFWLYDKSLPHFATIRMIVVLQKVILHGQK